MLWTKLGRKTENLVLIGDDVLFGFHTQLRSSRLTWERGIVTFSQFKNCFTKVRAEAGLKAIWCRFCNPNGSFFDSKDAFVHYLCGLGKTFSKFFFPKSPQQKKYFESSIFTHSMKNIISGRMFCSKFALGYLCFSAKFQLFLSLESAPAILVLSRKARRLRYSF